jgi:hypothetical protein
MVTDKIRTCTTQPICNERVPTCSAVPLTSCVPDFCQQYTYLQLSSSAAALHRLSLLLPVRVEYHRTLSASSKDLDKSQIAWHPKGDRESGLAVS